MIYLFGCHELATGLAGLHKVYVVLQEGCIQYAFYPEVVADVGNGKHILEGYGLAANQVGTGLNAHEGYLLRAILLDGLAEGVKVEVALEGVVACRDKSFLVNKLDYLAAKTGDVGLGRGEVEVHQGYHAGLYVCLGQNILCGAALVSGKHVVGAEYLFNRSLYAVEGFRSCIRIVRNAHCGYLLVGHSVYAGIREHVHIYIFILKEEGVVTCFLNSFQTLFYWKKI